MVLRGYPWPCAQESLPTILRDDRDRTQVGHIQGVQEPYQPPIPLFSLVPSLPGTGFKWGKEWVCYHKLTVNQCCPQHSQFSLTFAHAYTHAHVREHDATPKTDRAALALPNGGFPEASTTPHTHSQASSLSAYKLASSFL